MNVQYARTSCCLAYWWTCFSGSQPSRTGNHFMTQLLLSLGPTSLRPLTDLFGLSPWPSLPTHLEVGWEPLRRYSRLNYAPEKRKPLPPHPSNSSSPPFPRLFNQTGAKTTREGGEHRRGEADVIISSPPSTYYYPTNVASVHLVMDCPNARTGVRRVKRATLEQRNVVDLITNYHYHY